jgi:hypothetical protein
MLKISTVADHLGVSDNKVRQLVKSGQLLAKKLEGVTVIDSDDLSAFMEGLPSAATTPHSLNEQIARGIRNPASSPDLHRAAIDVTPSTLAAVGEALAPFADVPYRSNSDGTDPRHGADAVADNLHSAAMAFAGLASFAGAYEDGGLASRYVNGDTDTLMADFLASVMHLCDVFGVAFRDAAGHAAVRYSCDIEGHR